jgi:hypothetical protein
MEIVISAGVVSAAALAFFFFVEHFKVWEEPAYDRESWEHRPPRFNLSTQTWLRDPNVGDLARNSFLFVAAAALTFALLPASALSGPEAKDQPVEEARGSDVLIIDGDRDGDHVMFDHAFHVEKQKENMNVWDEDETCSRCHHMNLPQDDATSCSACHVDMMKPVDIFDHSKHVVSAGGNAGCVMCHEDLSVPKRRETAKGCFECHDRLVAEGAFFVPEGEDVLPAPGYVDAMHDLCVECHTEQVEQGKVRDDAGEVREGFAWCATCHTGNVIVMDPQRPDTPPGGGKED